MADIMNTATRSRMMASIRGKNTKPELTIRKALYAKGLRYKLHVRELPGKPDLVFLKYKTVVFVHGCFWHQHGCAKSTIPKTNVEFWTMKLETNRARDKLQIIELLSTDWRVAVIWECTVIKYLKEEMPILIEKVANWITASNEKYREF